MARNATTVANELGALWSPNLDQYIASGGASGLLCVLCRISPCSCPPFGSPEYVALMNRRHGRNPR